MSEIVEIDPRTHFRSVNGGITMCRERFADRLVDGGLDEFYKAARYGLQQSPGSTDQNHWRSLLRGVEALGKDALNRALDEPGGALVSVGKYDQELRCCDDELESTVGLWKLAANRAKEQIDRWEPWVVDAEANWQKCSFLLAGHSAFDPYRRLQATFKLCGAGALLEAPERLQQNLEFFKAQIEEIRAVVGRAYRASELPNELSVSEFDNAIDDLTKAHERWADLVGKRSESLKRLTDAYGGYLERRRPLLGLLGNLPDTAQWALFCLCRPDLFPPLRS